MKKIILCMCAVLLIGFSYTADAQVSIRINLNHQPAWGPRGYDRADFYYFPDLNVYYDVNSSIFYYLSGSRWVSNRHLPSRYNRYNFYKLHKVVLNNGPRPWLRNRDHRREYMRFRGDRSQTPIRFNNNRKSRQGPRNDQRQGPRNDQRQGPRNDQRQGGKQDHRQGPRNDQKVDNQKNRQPNNRKSDNKHPDNKPGEHRGR
jgi:hypothetical protein